MTGLLDTHTFMWWDSDQSRLSPPALAFISDLANVILLSAACVWEIQVKVRLGKLALNGSLPAVIGRQLANGLQLLPIGLNHVLALDGLPVPHKDPFDRILAAQTVVEGAALISADPIFARYPVSVLW